MADYHIDEAVFIGDNGSEAKLHDVDLTFAERRVKGKVYSPVRGSVKYVDEVQGELCERGKVVFSVTTDNFGVHCGATMRLNNCILRGSQLKAMPDSKGNVASFNLDGGNSI